MKANDPVELMFVLNYWYAPSCPMTRQTASDFIREWWQWRERCAKMRWFRRAWLRLRGLFQTWTLMNVSPMMLTDMAICTSIIELRGRQANKQIFNVIKFDSAANGKFQILIFETFFEELRQFTFENRALATGKHIDTLYVVVNRDDLVSRTCETNGSG